MKTRCPKPRCPWKKEGLCLWVHCPYLNAKGGEAHETDRKAEALDRLLHRDGQRDGSGAQTDENAAVAVHFEDSYIVDKETERARDAQEVRDGLLLPWEFRVRWYGEDEETAKARLAEASAAAQWFEA